jgi:hypothetical protein
VNFDLQYGSQPNDKMTLPFGPFVSLVGDEHGEFSDRSGKDRRAYLREGAFTLGSKRDDAKRGRRAGTTVRASELASYLARHGPATRPPPRKRLLPAFDAGDRYAGRYSGNSRIRADRFNRPLVADGYRYAPALPRR